MSRHQIWGQSIHHCSATNWPNSKVLFWLECLNHILFTGPFEIVIIIHYRFSGQPIDILGLDLTLSKVSHLTHLLKTFWLFIFDSNFWITLISPESSSHNIFNRLTQWAHWTNLKKKSTYFCIPVLDCWPQNHQLSFNKNITGTQQCPLRVWTLRPITKP